MVLQIPTVLTSSPVRMHLGCFKSSQFVVICKATPGNSYNLWPYLKVLPYPYSLQIEHSYSFIPLVHQKNKIKKISNNILNYMDLIIYKADKFYIIHICSYLFIHTFIFLFINPPAYQSFTLFYKEFKQLLSR